MNLDDNGDEVSPVSKYIPSDYMSSWKFGESDEEEEVHVTHNKDQTGLFCCTYLLSLMLESHCMLGHHSHTSTYTYTSAYT